MSNVTQNMDDFWPCVMYVTQDRKCVYKYHYIVIYAYFAACSYCLFCLLMLTNAIGPGQGKVNIRSKI